MKAIHIIPPAVALVAVIVWNLPRRQPADALEAESRALRDRIERAGSRETASSGQRPQADRTVADGDWRKLGARMKTALESTDMDEPPELEAFYERVSEMTRDEILTALDEVASAGLGEDERELLEETLVEALVALDPERVLAVFADRIHDDADGVGSQLSTALHAWAEKDPAAAIAWFDGQIAAGIFESKSLDGLSEARLEFEAALAGALLSRDVAAAGRRIDALPEDQRAAAMEQVSLSGLEPSALKDWVGLIRSLVPEEQREGPFAQVISERASEGEYPEAGAFLDDIQATPAERVFAAGLVANSRLEMITDERAISRQDLDELRTWLERQAPGESDRLTGEALATAGTDLEETDFSKFAELVLEIHRASGNDEVLAAFLEGSGVSSHPAKARALAGEIADPQRRQEILESLK